MSGKKYARTTHNDMAIVALKCLAVKQPDIDSLQNHTEFKRVTSYRDGKVAPMYAIKQYGKQRYSCIHF